MAENQAEKIKGTVEDVTYYNEENGYTVMTVSAGDDAVTVVGNSLPVAEGVQIEACGEWVMHPTFGRQLKADSIKLTMPENAAGMLNYLQAESCAESALPPHQK